MKSGLSFGEVSFIQQKLRARQIELQRDRPHAADGEPASSDPAASSAGQERDRHEMRDIDDALERISAGTYGICLRCGKPIDRARLDLFPTARYDMTCMETEEEHGALTACPSSP